MSTAAILLEWLAPQPGEDVLDLGCGLGLHSTAIARCGASVTGADPETQLLEQARLVCPSGKFLAAGLFDLDPSLRFDAIFAHAVLHWIHPPEAAVRRLFDLLRPGGRIAASYGAKAAEAANLVNCYLPDRAQCLELFHSAGFTAIHVEGSTRGILLRAARPVTG